VNLATHLLHDAWSDAFDVAAVISNDTDLCEPIKIVNAELNKVVGVLCPAASCSQPLRNVAKFVKHIGRRTSRPRSSPTRSPARQSRSRRHGEIPAVTTKTAWHAMRDAHLGSR